MITGLFGFGLSQMLANTQRLQAELAQRRQAEAATTMQPAPANDHAVIDVEARIVEDTPALPAPTSGEAS